MGKCMMRGAVAKRQSEDLETRLEKLRLFVGMLGKDLNL